MVFIKRFPFLVSCLLIALLVIPVYHGELCPHTCGTPDNLHFCSHISFPACQVHGSWKESDEKAFTGFNESTSSLSKEIQSNQSDPCILVMKKLHCALRFPVCEIGSDTNRLCLSACTEAIKNQCPTLIGTCSKLETTLYGSEGSCFQLNYTGPQVGMWVAGFTISLVFSILNSVGLNLQKFSLSRNDKVPIKRTTCQQPLWLLGFSLVCLGSLLDFVAFGMAPQSLLAPLAALSLVWNLFIAPIFHKEKITRRNIIATCIIFLGVTITVIYAGHNTPSYQLEDLLMLYAQPVMYVYIIAVCLFLLFLFISTKIIETYHVYEDGLFHIICYGGIAGTFGGQSVLLAKSTVELIKSSFLSSTPSHGDTWYRVEPYLLIGGLTFCLISQITSLNGGLKRFDALVIVPVYQSFWIFTSILGGIMYFEEYVSMTYTQTFMFPIGGAITLLGIVYLLKGRRNRTPDLPNVKYVELSKLPPTDAWDADLSDEESFQQQLDNNFDDDLVVGSGSQKPQLKPLGSHSKEPKENPRMSPDKQGNKDTEIEKKIKVDEEEDLFQYASKEQLDAL